MMVIVTLSSYLESMYECGKNCDVSQRDALRHEEGARLQVRVQHAQRRHQVTLCTLHILKRTVPLPSFPSLIKPVIITFQLSKITNQCIRVIWVLFDVLHLQVSYLLHLIAKDNEPEQQDEICDQETCTSQAELRICVMC